MTTNTIQNTVQKTTENTIQNADDRAELDVFLSAQSAVRVMRRCQELARCSDSKTGLTRTFLSPAMSEAHALVAAWMRQAGMTTRVDALGNLIGYFPSRDEVQDGPIFLLGSHLDTVPNAGRFDGMLGVMLAIEAVASLGCALPFALEVVGFSEEEGVRFKTPYLGSRAVAGTFDANYLEIMDKDGISMRQAIAHFGLSDNWQSATQKAPVLGYLEAHIEQGPTLEERGVALGIVSAIAGQSRLQVRFSGHAGHAGTLPMNGRRDALTAASEWILEVEALARRVDGLVATVGWAEVAPNTPNVVAGQVTCSLDVRHALDLVREEAVAQLGQSARKLAERRDIGFEILARNAQVAVAMNDLMRRDLQRVCESLGVAAPDIVSGAGHDAAIIASFAPVAMLFLRTPGGASHCPEEAVLIQDVALALDAMRGFLLQSARDWEDDDSRAL